MLHRHFFLFGLLSISLINSALSQGWADSYNKSIEAYQIGDLEKALSLATSALGDFKAEVGDDHKNVAVLNRQLALITFEKGDLANALLYANDEIKTLQKIGETSDFNYGSSLYNAALIHNARSEYDAAAKLLDEATLIYSDYLEANDPEFLVLKGNHAVSLFHLGQDEASQKLFEEVFPALSELEEQTTDYFNIAYNYSALLREKGQLQASLAPLEVVFLYYQQEAQPGLGNVLTKLGDTWQQLGDFAKASEYLRKAKSFFEETGEIENSEYLIALNFLATNLEQQGKYKEAEEILVKLAEQAGAAAGNSEISTPLTYINLGGLAFNQGDFEKSIDWYQKVVNAYEKREGPDEYLAMAYIGISKSYLKANETARSDSFVQKTDSTLSILGTYSKTLEINFRRQRAAVLLASGQLNAANEILVGIEEETIETFGVNSVQYGSVSSLLAIGYRDMAEYSKSDGYFKKAQSTILNVYGAQHQEYAIVLSNYASLKQLQGFYLEAEELLKQSLLIKESQFGTNNVEYLISLENLATLYYQTARFEESEVTFQKTIEGNRSIYGDKHPIYAYSLRNLGVLKRTTGDFTASEKLLLQSTEILEGSIGKEHLVYISVMNDLGLLYMSLGNLDAAMPLFESARSFYESTYGKNHPDYASSLENISTILLMEGKEAEAIQLLEEALSIDEEVLGKNHPLYSKTLHNLASISQKRGDLDKAQQLYEESLAIYSETVGKNHPSYANTLYNLAVLAQDKENFPLSEKYFLDVLSIRRNTLGENHPDYAYTLFGLASVNQRLKNWDNAYQYYEEALRKYDKLIVNVFPALSEEEKSAFYAKIKPVYMAFQDFAVEFVVSKNERDELSDRALELLYDVQLSTKALLLNASNKVRRRIAASNDQKLIALFEDWISSKELLAKAYSYSLSELEKNGIELTALESRANSLEKQLSENSQEFANEFDKEAITWAKVKATLSPSDAAIEILRIKKNIKNDSIVYAGVIVYGNPDKKMDLVFFPNGRQLEEKYFVQYKNSVLYQLEDKQSYGIYWEPFDRKLATEKNVYLSSDGIFNKLNVNTLFNTDSLSYVIDTKNIYLLSNTRELAEKKPQRSGEKTASLFGFPDYDLEIGTNGLLASASSGAANFQGTRAIGGFDHGVSALPGTLKEINSIASILEENNWQFQKLLNVEATEENFKKIEKASIVHIATHGFFLEDFDVTKVSESEGLQSRSVRFNPLLRSGVLLAGANKTLQNQKLEREEDGVLTAYEAMNLNLDQTELVVMSACETGLGEIRNGEGVYGLQRAFMVAGAKSVIMSLWKVNDETTQKLMTNFYSEWFKNGDKYNAFKDAVLEIKKEFPSPYYWGAFILLGE